MPYQVTENMLADEEKANPLAKPHADFSRDWHERNCDAADFALMRTVRGWYWGPGLVLSETDYLAQLTGRSPSREEVVAMMTRVNEIDARREEAWFHSAEREGAMALRRESQQPD